MAKILAITIVLAAAAMFASAPSRAYYNGPWCGVATLGPGSVVEKCDYRDFETCRMDVVAGNRGFCRPNGYYTGAEIRHPARPHNKRKHAQR